MKTDGKNGSRLIDAALDYLFEKYNAWLTRCLQKPDKRAVRDSGAGLPDVFHQCIQSEVPLLGLVAEAAAPAPLGMAPALTHYFIDILIS